MQKGVGLSSELMSALLNEKRSKQVTDPRHCHRFVRGRYGVVPSILPQNTGIRAGERGSES